MTEPERDLRVESWSFLDSKQLDGNKAVAAPTPWKIAAIGFDSIVKNCEIFFFLTERRKWREKLNVCLKFIWEKWAEKFRRVSLCVALRCSHFRRFN